MLDCTTDTYDRLYSRWLDRPGALLDWAKFKHTDKLLDLCGGTGAISKEALERNAKQVWLLDLNPRIKDPRIEPITCRAEDLGGRNHRSYPDWDLVICRQALGYLDLPKLSESLRNVLAPRGRFVFNTFLNPKWSLKTYLFKNERFLEASANIGRHCFHLQAMDGDFDITHFRWHTEKDILSAFGGWSIADVKRTDTTLWYSFERP